MRVATSACAGSSAMRNIRTISTGWAELEVGSMFGAYLQLRGRSVDSRSVYVPPLAATISRLAHVSEQPCRWHRGGRPFCPSNDRVPDSLLSCHHTAWTTNLAVVWRDGKPDCGVDLAPDHRGFPMGPHAAISHPGSGYLVWASLRATSARHGYSRSTDCVPITLAKCICREAHWLDPPGVPGPHDRIRSSAPAPDPRRICRLL